MPLQQSILVFTGKTTALIQLLPRLRLFLENNKQEALEILRTASQNVPAEDTYSTILSSIQPTKEMAIWIRYVCACMPADL
jgi:hypothetical protein